MSTQDGTIRAMTLAGCSARDIAAALGIAKRTVYRRRAALGIAKEKPPVRDQELHEQAQRLLDDGASYREVSKTLGVARSTIRSWFPGRGWDFHAASEHANFCRQMASVINGR